MFKSMIICRPRERATVQAEHDQCHLQQSLPRGFGTDGFCMRGLTRQECLRGRLFLIRS